MSPVRLRMIFTNDVYELKNYARFKTAVETLKDKNSVTIMAGDFLAPSLLSSLDNGVGVVDVMNTTGFDYAVFGNHECDVHQDYLLDRIGQSKFQWINSNMQSLNMQGAPALPEYIIQTVTMGTVTKRVGLLGLLSNDPHLYRPGSFGGAIIEPVISTYEKLSKQLLDEEHVDLIVPITHQSMKDDRKMAKTLSNVPVILGGHDHEYYHETVRGTQIVKTGMDLQHFDVVDIEWTEESNYQNYTVNVTKYDTADFAADEQVLKQITESEEILRSLADAPLCRLPMTEESMSSVNIRLQQTSVGTLLVSALRDSFLSDCAIFNAGGIRANKLYDKGRSVFTYADLENEMPFDNEVVCVRMPGKVFQEIIRYSRRNATLDPPAESGGYMQVDDGVRWDSATQTITHIANKPMEPEKMYDVVCVELHLKGIDNIEPMVNFATEYPELIPEDGIPVKQVLVRYFSRNVWMHIGSFCSLDTDDNGSISRSELRAAAVRRISFTNSLDFLLDNWFKETDEDCDGEISPAEMCSAVLHTGFTMFDLNHDGVLEWDEVKHFMERTLGRPVENQGVDELFSIYDKDGTGVITREAVRQRALQPKTCI